MIERSQSVDFHLTPFRVWLDDPDITEICVNRPGEVWCERTGAWERHDSEALTLAHLNALSVAVAKYGHNTISDSRPILAGNLPAGERVHLVRSPACESGTLSVTIRKPTTDRITIDTFDEQGFFDHVEPAGERVARGNDELSGLLEAGQHREFLTRAVALDRVVVVAGETGSGKTTLMKALTDWIPTDQRIITIEDVPELELPNHPNHVHLFYPSEATDDSPVTAAKLLKSCMRMKPTRIMLAECRGAETYDFINSAASGHGGSITSCHAGSCAMTFERMALMMLQNRQGRALPYDVIMRMLRDVIDVVVHVHVDAEHGRHITEVWFQP